MDGLVAGRIVHYVQPDAVHRAAIVTQVLEPDPDIQTGEHCADLAVFGPLGVHWVMDVPFDAAGTRPYSWHWIDRG